MKSQTIILGRLGRDPESRTTPSGKVCARFQVAVDDNGKDQPPTWYNVVAWDKLAETCSKHLTKGRLVQVDGRMTSRKYTDKKGVERVAWELKAHGVEFLDKPSGDRQPDHQEEAAAAPFDATEDDVPF